MSLWNGILRLLLPAVCANVPFASAQDNVATDDPDGSLPRKILVLKSGRVVKGKIKPRGNGYDIKQQNGQLFVGSEQVWLLADNLSQAHQTMRDSFSSLTPDVHMKIASWCAKNQLFGTARSELLDALHKDPYREKARRMLANLIRLQNSPIGSSSATDSSAWTDTIAAGMVLPRRSLGGLSSKLARDFTRQIQPLLSHKCSGCHDVGNNRLFVLKSVDNGSNSGIASKNLAAVLRQINTAPLSCGQFLQIAMSQHGGMKSVPFPGRVGAVQRHRLSSWVDRVRREKQLSTAQHSASRQPSSMDTKSGVRHADYRTQQRHESSAVSADFVVPDNNPHALNRSSEETEKEMLVDARRRNRIDKFDPNIFNRRYRIRPGSVNTDSGLAARRGP